jgi:hypothetical protein
MRRGGGWGSCVPRRGYRPLMTPKDALNLLFSLCGLIVGLYLFLRGFRLLQRKKWIEDTPVTKIAGAAIGAVKVFGKVTGPYTLLSPLAQVDCYYYRTTAWNGRDAQREDQLEGKATETIFTPFFVEDETGRLMVDPRGAQLELPAEYEEQISGDSMGECSRRFLRRRGLSTQGETTVTEWVIKPGDLLLVLGTLGGADGKGGDVGAAYLSSEAADLQRREQVEAMGLSSERATTPSNVDLAFDLQPRVVLRKGDREQPFLLSRDKPQSVIDDLALRAVVNIWGGPVLALISLGFLVKSLGVW